MWRILSSMRPGKKPRLPLAPPLPDQYTHLVWDPWIGVTARWNRVHIRWGRDADCVAATSLSAWLLPSHQSKR